MSEVIGIFSSIRDLNEAVDKLLSHGFNQHSLRVIANELVFNTQFHLNYKTIYDVINDQSIPKKTLLCRRKYCHRRRSSYGIFGIYLHIRRSLVCH